MLRNFLLFSAIGLILFSLSCSSTEHSQNESIGIENTSGKLPFESPATFTGTIPCETCLKVDITLNILPNSMYQLRKTYIQRTSSPKIESQIGKWVYLPQDNLLILGKQIGLLKTYRVEDSNRLVFVEWEGTDSESQIQYELLRSAKVDPFDDVVKIKGYFSEDNGSGKFTECSTDKTFSVSKEKDYITLLQSYMNTPHEKNQPLLTTVFGRIDNKEGDQSLLVIENLHNIYPDVDCGGNKIRSSLVGTFWRLQDVNGITLSHSSNEKPPFLLLNEDRSFRAFAYCNDITGSYLVKGDLFLINRKLDIRAACPQGLEVEYKLIKALENTKTFRINNQILELLNQDREVLARFEAGT